MTIIKKGRPIRGNSKRVRVSFTLEPKNIEKLDSLAKNIGVSKSEALDIAIAAFVQNKPSLNTNKNDSVYPMIPIPKIKLIEFCKSKGIKNLSLFGSALTSEFNAKSDIDLLAEFKQENIPTLFELVGFESDLSELFNGRKIDLRTKGDLSEHVRKNVIKNIFPIYEERT